jgi:hypothetical protein
MSIALLVLCLALLVPPVVYVRRRDRGKATYSDYYDWQ